MDFGRAFLSSHLVDTVVHITSALSIANKNMLELSGAKESNVLPLAHAVLWIIQWVCSFP